MKVDFSAQILNEDDATIPVPKIAAEPKGYAPNGAPLYAKDDTEPMTLAYAAKTALGKLDPQRGDADKMADDLALALRVRGGGVIEITEDEATRIKARITARWAEVSTMIPARAALLLKGMPAETPAAAA